MDKYHSIQTMWGCCWPFPVLLSLVAILAQIVTETDSWVAAWAKTPCASTRGGLRASPVLAEAQGPHPVTAAFPTTPPIAVWRVRGESRRPLNHTAAGVRRCISRVPAPCTQDGRPRIEPRQGHQHWQRAQGAQGVRTARVGVRTLRDHELG